jgi:type I restriction enzyme S subunit
MNSWAEHQLSDLVPTTISGEWGSEPTGDGDALVLRAADFTKDCKFRKDIGAARSIPGAKLRSIALKDGDILIEKSGGSPDQPVGRVAFFDRSNDGDVYAPSNFLQLLRVANGFDKKFTHYLLVHLYFSGRVFRYQQQTTGIINLKLENYLREKVAIPHPLVQQKIRMILSTIDQAIEKTETLIKKYQQIKAGLMHDLFTRGIGADGNLRLPREQAPELYQKTPTGWVPKEWGTAPLRHYLLDNPTNGIYKPADQIGEGVLMVGQTAFTKERSVDFSLCRRGAVSEAEAKHYALEEGNILVTRVFATVEGVGLPTLVPEVYERAVFESNMMRLRVDNKKIVPLILFEWLRGHPIRKLILAEANASNQVSVNQKMLNSLPVPLIEEGEQSAFVCHIEGISKKYFSEKTNLEKLIKQKSGLMHDLLTGKVQVTVDQTEALHV